MIVYDPKDRRLVTGVDDAPCGQREAYLALPQSRRRRGFAVPLRTGYRHTACGQVTAMVRELAETYACDPWFYSTVYCWHCQKHRRLYEFRWEPDGQTLEPDDWSEAEQVAARERMRQAKAPKVFGRIMSDAVKVRDYA